jgi:hypothetical protein
MKPDGTTDDSDDDVPLSRMNPKKRSKVKGDGSADDSDDELPLVARSKRERKKRSKVEGDGSADDSDDDVARLKRNPKTGSKVKGRARRKKIESDDEEEEEEVASKRQADFSIIARTHTPRKKTTARKDPDYIDSRDVDTSDEDDSDTEDSDVGCSTPEDPDFLGTRPDRKTDIKLRSHSARKSTQKPDPISVLKASQEEVAAEDKAAKRAEEDEEKIETPVARTLGSRLDETKWDWAECQECTPAN